MLDKLREKREAKYRSRTDKQREKETAMEKATTKDDFIYAYRESIGLPGNHYI